MPSVHITETANADGVIYFRDGVSVSDTTYTYDNPQSQFTLTNTGTRNIIFSVGSLTNITVIPGDTYDTGVLPSGISSFTIRAQYGYQSFTMDSIEVAVDRPTLTSLSEQLADMAKHTNIIKFGADLTGTNFSDQAFSNAIASGYDTIFLPAGTYKIQNPYILTNISLIGAGVNTTYIDFYGTGTALTFNSGNGGIQVRGFQLRSQARSQNGILWNVTGGKLEGVIIRNFDGTSLQLGTSGVVGDYYNVFESVQIYVINAGYTANTGILVPAGSSPASNANMFLQCVVNGDITNHVWFQGAGNQFYGGDISWTGANSQYLFRISGVGNVVRDTWIENTGTANPKLVWFESANSYGNKLTDLRVSPIGLDKQDDGQFNEVYYKPIGSNFYMTPFSTGVNLARNSNFKYWYNDGAYNIPMGFKRWSGNTISKESTIKHGDGYSIKAVLNNDDLNLQYYLCHPTYSPKPIDDINRYKGKFITVGVWAYCETNILGCIKIQTDGTGSVNIGAMKPTKTGEWQFLMIGCRVPNDATYISAQLRASNTSGSYTGNVYFSDLIICEGLHLPHSQPRALTDGEAKMFGRLSLSPFITISAGTTTPSVVDGNTFKTSNTAATTITGFTNGVEGQEIKVIFNDAFTTVDFTGTTLKGNVGVDWAPKTGDHMNCIYDGTNWYCTINKNS